MWLQSFGHIHRPLLWMIMTEHIIFTRYFLHTTCEWIETSPHLRCQHAHTQICPPLTQSYNLKFEKWPNEIVNDLLKLPNFVNSDKWPAICLVISRRATNADNDNSCVHVTVPNLHPIISPHHYQHDDRSSNCDQVSAFVLHVCSDGCCGWFPKALIPHTLTDEYANLLNLCA